MTSLRKVNSFIQHRFGEQLFCSSQSFEVSSGGIIYSKTAAHTSSYHMHDSTIALDLFCLYLLIPERHCCVTVTCFYFQETTASPPVQDTLCPWQQTPTNQYEFPQTDISFLVPLLRKAFVLGTEAMKVFN